MERGAIHLHGVTKSFRAYHARSFKESAIRLLHRQPLVERREILRGIDLDVRPGERLGIVGKNGAGKSTLFRIISGILRPDAGTMEVTGRVSPLIEITSGLVPDLSGQENLVLNTVLLGLSLREAEARRDAIVEFAGIRDFLETPTRYYSSGMQARLGFAVAVHVDADILLVDEVLSVGDAEFQRKCLERMAELSRQGRTIVVVSHDPALIRDFSHRVVEIEDGLVRAPSS